MVISAAAPLGKDVEDTFRLKFKKNGTNIKQAWGMSELSPVGTLTPDSKTKSGSGTIGPLVSNSFGKIVCLDTGNNLPPGESNTGELCIKGPQENMGYYKEEEEQKGVYYRRVAPHRRYSLRRLRRLFLHRRSPKRVDKI